MSSPLSLEFVKSVPDLDLLGESRAEVALVGRSNVGKSSLVNSLANRNKLAKTSKTPGATRLLNLYEVGDGTTLVDCPGYGYAAVSKAERNSWQKMMDRYFLEREPLTMVAVLVDGEIGPTKLDAQMLEWLRANELPHSVVATKHDKVKAAQRDKRKKELAAGCQLDPSDVFWTSAAKHVGIDRLRDALRIWLTP
ncbi:MAG: engB [Actinomycetia bacterium]|nr:engB [Actinomycetes bacterium]